MLCRNACRTGIKKEKEKKKKERRFKMQKRKEKKKKKNIYFWLESLPKNTGNT